MLLPRLLKIKITHEWTTCNVIRHWTLYVRLSECDHMRILVQDYQPTTSNNSSHFSLTVSRWCTDYTAMYYSRKTRRLLSTYLVALWLSSTQVICDEVTPSDLYLGLFSEENTNQNFTVFKRDNFQHSCVTFPSAPNHEGLSEECKYYGDCCKDPMRIREKLEPGTFACEPVSSLGELG